MLSDNQVEFDKLFKVSRLAKGMLDDQNTNAYIYDQTHILVCGIYLQDLPRPYLVVHIIG